MFAGGGGMDANTDTLARVVQMATVVVQEIEGHRGRLEGEVTSVIPAQWNMEQSQALLVAHRKWDAAIRNLCQKLEKLGEDTRFAMNDYQDVDQQGVACFNGVDDSGLGGGASGLGGGMGGFAGAGTMGGLGSMGGLGLSDLGGGFGSDLGLSGDSGFGGDSGLDLGDGFDFGGGDSDGGDSDGGDSDSDDDDSDDDSGGGDGDGGGSSGGGGSSDEMYAFSGLLRAL